MNDEGREALVAAALRGHTQAVGQMHSYTENADCALGVLHLAVHDNDREYVLNNCQEDTALTEIFDWFGVSIDDRYDIIERNDLRGQDFLTIARKVGYDED